MKYRIYIDEVGNPDLESSDNPNHRFLSLTGIILELGYVKEIIYPQLEALKAKYFQSHPENIISGKVRYTERNCYKNKRKRAFSGPDGLTIHLRNCGLITK